MVDEKLMTSVRYSSEPQKEDFQRKIVGKTTARFVFTDAVQMYIATGKTAGQMSTALFGLRQENDRLEKRVAELEAELATIQEKCGADFEKVRFIETPKLESCADCMQEGDELCPGEEGECAFVPGGRK